MVALMRLPQYNPGNQLIDLSPINQGFASIQQRRQTDIQNQRADEQLGMQRDQFGMQKQQFEAQQKAQQVKTLANRASVISGLPEGQRQAAWQRMVQASPQLATALQENGVDPNDHVAGPRMIIAEAGQYDPMGDKLKQAQLAKIGMDVKLTNAQLDRARLDAETNKELKPLQVDAARVGLDTARAKLDALRSKASSPNLIADPEKRAQVEAGLRKELTARTSDYRVLRDAARTINAVAKNPSPAGDLSLIFSYMKVLDPTSVVRESEQAMATNAAGVPERVRDIYNKVLFGTKLTESQRKDFITKAQALANQKRRGFEADIRDYSAISRRFGLDPRNIAIGTDPIEPPKAQESPKVDGKAPQAGTYNWTPDGGLQRAR